MTIRIGIVGAGKMGTTHGRILCADPRVQIAGIVDVIGARAKALALETNSRAVESVGELMGIGLDAVYITTPNTKHVPLALAALQQSINVFSEKPMATMFEEAKKIRDVAKQNQAIYQIGHNRRFAPAYQFLKEKVNAGFTPYLASAKQNDGDWLNPPWITNQDLTGGFLYESTVHLLDMLRWLMGDVVAVNARAQSPFYNLLCDFSILLTFRGNHSAVLTSSAHASWAFPFEALELVGDHACLRTEEMKLAMFSAGLEQEVMVRDFSQLPNRIQWGYQQEDDAFLTAITNHTAPAVDAEEAFKSIELCEACYRSVATDGATVTLPL